MPTSKIVFYIIFQKSPTSSFTRWCDEWRSTRGAATAIHQKETNVLFLSVVGHANYQKSL